MDKKLIRLTEQDLHKIVKESVNKILSEMDWKTYLNAAKKQASVDKYFLPKQKGMRTTDSRKKAFMDAAFEKFKKDYGGDDNTEILTHNYPYDGGISIWQHSNSENGCPVIYNKGKNNRLEVGSHRWGKPKTDRYFGDGAYDRMNNMYDERDAFLNGDYEYDSIKDGGEGKWKRKKK